MQRPTGPGRGAELESTLESLNISRDHDNQTQASQEPSSTGSDQHHGSQAGSSGEQRSGQQIGGALKASHEEVWYLKSIDFTSPSGETRTCNVITQNYNGCVYHRYYFIFLRVTRPGRPCSFIAICNILILRGQIEILPPDRKSVSYEFLAQLVGEHILLTAPDVDVSGALSMMPLTTSEAHLHST